MTRFPAVRRTTGLAALLAALAAVLMIAACSGPTVTPRGGGTGSPTERREPPVVTDPTKPVAFVQLGSDEVAANARVEITDPAALDRYLRGLPQHVVGAIRSQLTAHLPVATGDRLFAFLLSGCAETGAQLLVGPPGTGVGGLAARLTGGANTECYVPVTFVAIFAVPAGLVR